MMTQEKILVLVNKFGKTGGLDIGPATNIKDLRFDSLDLLEFQMGIDDEFGIELSIDDFLKCRTIGDIAGLVEQCSLQK